ncbi:GNAT family N-acetyltransferase [Parasediminibacterium sp. JCM 36343]|uniref:GNAT family N-acetyltransferase n=1 Tax=Parasediminibacterium sp. JCM 36343 TaxID=3374279 RepID=UPI00397D145B
MQPPFNFSEQYSLENERVLLAPLDGNNSTQLLHFALGGINIWPFSLMPMLGEANFKKYIDFALLSRVQQTAYPFIVFDKVAKEFAGSTRFYDIQLANQTLQLGYTWYDTKFQGTGLNKNCKFLLLQFAFETMGMERVEFRADNNNKRSIAAMQSIGCTIEGILRSNVPNAEGGRRDSIVLSILKSEWEGGIKERLGRKIGN